MRVSVSMLLFFFIASNYKFLFEISSIGAKRKCVIALCVSHKSELTKKKNIQYNRQSFSHTHSSSLNEKKLSLLDPEWKESTSLFYDDRIQIAVSRSSHFSELLFFFSLNYQQLHDNTQPLDADFKWFCDRIIREKYMEHKLSANKTGDIDR